MAKKKAPKKKKNKDNKELFWVVRMRIYPTDVQIQRLETWLESLRWLYNRSLRERKDAYSQNKRTITFKEQKSALPALKKECPDLKSVPSPAVQGCVKRLQTAFDNFFRRVKERKEGSRVKVGYPRFKKYGSYCSLSYPQAWMKQTDKEAGKVENKEIIKLCIPKDVSMDVSDKDFKAFWGSISFPKLGDVNIRVHRPIDWKKAKSVTIKKMPNGDWYACARMQITPVQPEKGKKKIVGIDLGLKELVTTSEGEYFPHPRCLKKSEEKLKCVQRKLSRHEKGSNNWEKQRQKVAKLHTKIKNQRMDFLHKLSFQLVKNYTHIVFEKLNILNMVKCKNFAKSILDAGWGKLVELTTYKSVMRGGSTIQVDPKYTTQDCSRCGERVPKALSERIHNCPKCGLKICRDVNAANNILHRAGMGQSPGRSSA